MLSFVVAGIGICISKVAPDMQFGAKQATPAFDLSVKHLSTLDLCGSKLNWDLAAGFLEAQSEVKSNGYCGCGGEGCPFCRDPAPHKVFKSVS